MFPPELPHATSSIDGSSSFIALPVSWASRPYSRSTARPVQPYRAVGARPDAVLPPVAGDEVAARVPHGRHTELADQRCHVAAEPVAVRLRMTGLVDAGVHAAAHVLDERAEDAPVHQADPEVTVDH